MLKRSMFLLAYTALVAAFDTPSRSIFKHRKYKLAQTSSSSGICPFESSIEKIIEIQKNEDEFSPEFIIYGDKSISKQILNDISSPENKGVSNKKEIPCCGQCYEKCKIFSEIRDLYEESTLESANIENLNYLQITENNSPVYCGCMIDGKMYRIAINHNSIDSIRDIIFLIRIDNTPHTLYRLMDMKISNFQFKHSSDKISESNIKISDDLMDVLKAGTSILTVRNVLIFLAGYYVFGTILVFLYYGLKNKEE